MFYSSVGLKVFHGLFVKYANLAVCRQKKNVQKRNLARRDGVKCCISPILYLLYHICGH